MYSIKKIRSKLKERMLDFSTHPVTKHNREKALMRYITFNTFGKVQKELTYNWLKPLKFYARIGDAGMSGNIYFGLTEINESLFTILLLRADDCFIDVGANLGHYSLLASGISNADSIAIEPVPSTFSQLVRQVELNQLGKKIRTINIGLADRNATLLFSSHRGTMNKVVHQKGESTVSIKVKKLDDIAAGKNPVLLKIDVEGYEKHVLKGAQETLKNPSLKAIIAELNGSGMAYGISDEEVFEMLTDHGFHAHRYVPEQRIISPLKTYNKDQYNTIFIRDIEFCRNRILSAMPVKIWNQSF